MKLPKQSAPVERTLAPATISGESGVEASGVFDDVLGIASKVAPIAAPILTSLI